VGVVAVLWAALPWLESPLREQRLARASEATERMCQTPSTGSVTVRTSIPAPVEVSSGRTRSVVSSGGTDGKDVQVSWHRARPA